LRVRAAGLSRSLQKARHNWIDPAFVRRPPVSDLPCMWAESVAKANDVAPNPALRSLVQLSVGHERIPRELVNTSPELLPAG
jgi:hypothetical protein